MSEEFKSAAELARDPSTIPVATYSWVAGVALLGGIVRIIREAKLSNKTWPQIIGIFVGELLVSCFAGVNTLFLCESMRMDPLYTALMVSTASYMGGRSLAIGEALFKSLIKSLAKDD